MPKLSAFFLSVLVVVAPVGTPNAFSQMLQGSREPDGGKKTEFRWTAPGRFVQQLGRNVTPGTKVTLPAVQHSNTDILAVLKRQQTSAQFAQGIKPSEANTSGMLLGNKTPTLLGPSQTSAATVSQIGGTVPSSLTAPGTQKEQPPSHPASSLAHQARTAPPPIAICKPGISDVNGSKAGYYFSPGYTYIIHGCGFGNQPGMAYLMDVHQDRAPSEGMRVAPLQQHSNWVQLQVPGSSSHQTQRTWTDTMIEVVVDPNANGFYDSDRAVVVVILRDGTTQYQAPNFNFFAARAQQKLGSLPRRLYGASSPTGISIVSPGSDFLPAHVTDSAGHAVQAQLLSPSAASVVLPGHTFAVIREDNGAPFPFGTDTFDLVYSLQPGFQVSSFQPFYANLTPETCPSKFSSSGNWNIFISGTDKLNISWQEQSCGTSGVSAYAADVWVEGPRGCNPF